MRSIVVASCARLSAARNVRMCFHILRFLSYYFWY